MIDLGDVRYGIISRKPHPLQALMVILGLMLATGIRCFTDRGANGVPFATFLPVVVLAAIFLDWGYAVATAVLTLVIVRLLFGVTGAGIAWPTLVLLLAYGSTAAFMIVVGCILRRTIQELDRQAEKFRAFNEELQHRAKNALQVVRAMASRAAKAPDPIRFYETLASRMDMLVKANELLGVGIVRQGDIVELAQLAVAPFPQGTISLSGPSALISDDAGMTLLMALHELGTNALKYGALSADSGEVTIDWTAVEGEIELVWQEKGGPLVVPPTTRGLGSRLLTAQGGLREVDLRFDPGGVVCRMVLPRAG
jgi:two-component sensor histidine kinase